MSSRVNVVLTPMNLQVITDAQPLGGKQMDNATKTALELWFVIPLAWVSILVSIGLLKLYFIRVVKDQTEYYKKTISVMRGAPIEDIEFNARGQAVGGYEFYLNQYKDGRPCESSCPTSRSNRKGA